MTRFFAVLLCCWCPATVVQAGSPWLIASAAGPAWPTSCPVSLAVAIERGADTVGFAVSMSSDGTVVVIPDPVLSGVSDADPLVAERLGDASSLAVPDLSLAELRQLTVNHAGTASADGLSGCRIAPLAETLDMINVLEIEQQRTVGIVIELRKLWVHRKANLDLGDVVVDLLTAKRPDRGDTTPRTYLAAYDPDELLRLHEQRLIREAPHIGIMQLIDENDGEQAKRLQWGGWLPYNYDWLFTNSGLRSIADHVDVIGLSPALVAGADQTKLHDFIGDVHLLGILLVISPADPLLDPGQAPPDEIKTRLNQLLADDTFDGLVTGNYDDIARLLDLKSPRHDRHGQPESAVEQIIENLKLNQSDGARSAEPLLFH